jgi:hypothetical protein
MVFPGGRTGSVSEMSTRTPDFREFEWRIDHRTSALPEWLNYEFPRDEESVPPLQ